MRKRAAKKKGNEGEFAPLCGDTLGKHLIEEGDKGRCGDDLAVPAAGGLAGIHKLGAQELHLPSEL